MTSLFIRSVPLIFSMEIRGLSTVVASARFQGHKNCQWRYGEKLQQPFWIRISPWTQQMMLFTKEARPRPDEGLKYESSSDSDSDDERPINELGISPFWRQKMRTVHALLDVNKDGVVSWDDFKLMADRFVDLGHLSSTQQQEFISTLKHVWEEQWGSMHPFFDFVSTEQYLTSMTHVLNDKSLRKKVHLALPYFFKAVDKDKSGEISVEEFKLFFKCLGLTEEVAVKSFDAIDTDKDGCLSMKEFIHQGREFFLSEDERKPSKLFWGPLVK